MNFSSKKLLWLAFCLTSKANCSQDCLVRTITSEVRGRSLEGSVEPGRTVRILIGYYNCNAIEREDIVAYQYRGNPVPIIKIAKGLPGDKFYLEEEGDRWKILINGKLLKNSRRQPYLLNAQAHRMLSLYEKDYHGVIPPHAYLILGNQAGGSLDSSHFGFVSDADILGKIVPARP